MKKIVSQSIVSSLTRTNKISLAVTVGVFMSVASLIPALQQRVLADQYDAQIKALSSQNAANQDVIDSLASQAASYNDAIQKLQAQITSLQDSIAKNKALQTELQNKIDEAQKEIDHQRSVLAIDIKAMYVDGTPTSLEMLATSKNLSDFVDKQEYRSRVQQKLQVTMVKIAELQKELQVQKAKVEMLIKDMQAQQAQLNSDRAKQQELLNYNQSEQSAYNAKIKANSAEVTRLRAEQAAANARLNSGGGVTAGDPNHGGYPSRWANAPQDSMVDSWGMYNRECVSYTAWKVYQTYGYMPHWGGNFVKYNGGNANQWPGDAAIDGIPTGHQPKARSVAISMAGGYGHAMWVEAVNSDGSIWVSQYNWYTSAGGWGSYSEMLVNASVASSLTYIYFN